MEINYQNLYLSETAPLTPVRAETSAEYQFPDYLPPARRVAAVYCRPFIEKLRSDAAVLAVSGVARFLVMYAPEDDIYASQLKSASFSAPFEAKLDCPTDENARVFVKCEEQSCRMLSSTKMLCRCSLSIGGEYIAEHDIQAAKEVEGGENLTFDIDVSFISASGTRVFLLEEDVEAKDLNPRPSEILKASLRLSEPGVKAVADKAIVKGKTVLGVLYLSDEKEGVFAFSEEIPYSMVIDVPSASFSDDDITNVYSQIKDFSAALMETNDGTRFFEVRAEIESCVQSERTERFTLMADSYAPGFALDLKKETQKTMRLVEKNQISGDFRKELDINGTPVDCEVTPLSKKIVSEDKRMMVEAVFSVCALYETDEGKGGEAGGEMFSVSDTITVSEELPLSKADGMSARFSGDIQLDYRCEQSYDGKTEVKGSFTVPVSVYESETAEIVTYVSSAETEPPSGSPLTVYYALDGDTLWDISKRFCASPAQIMADNMLESKELSEGQMLLIVKKL